MQKEILAKQIPFFGCIPLYVIYMHAAMKTK